MPATFSVPTVDFSGFKGSGDARDREIGHELVNACKTSGFAILTGTRITQQDIEAILAEAKRFFSLPEQTKDKIRHPPEAMNHVGWSAIERENVSQHVYDKEETAALRKKAPDYKESLEVWDRNHPMLHNLFLPDQDLPGFEERAYTYWEKCHELSQDVLRAIACGLPGDLPADFFDEYHQQRTCQLRLLHYPSAPREWFTTGRYSQLNAHTDFPTCTLLVQDDVGGLQVEDPNGEGSFIDVPSVPGGVVFNVADLLQMWSNDQLKSSKHRVVPPAARPGQDQSKTPDRFSMPYFISADWDKTVSCIPTCCSADKPAKYEPTNPGDYITKRMNAIY